MNDLPDRFWDKVHHEPNSGCWLWVGTGTGTGHGQFWLNNGMRLAHRVSYEAHCGPIPEDLQLDHLCRVRCCVNPDHLEPVTAKENSRRSPFYPAHRTHCPHGHEYTEDNIYIRPDGYRECKVCIKIRWKRNAKKVSTDLRQRQPRIKDPRHLDFIRSLPCMICSSHPVEAAHIRFASREHEKRPTGMQEKPSDKWSIPLCHHCHRTGPDAQHSTDERLWWESKGLDPLKIASALYAISGNVERGIEIIFNAKRKQTDVEGT